MSVFPETEYQIPFFDELGYIRKLCPLCKEHFWTQNSDQTLCGETTSEGCASYTFINNPPTRRQHTLREMREKFLYFFEKRGHKIIKPYPVVARWREDLYFTHASIVDFQPHVTDGISPAPANPLVISQPCIRFVDLDNVGPTFGRHLTIFEMGGHHAFNYPNEYIYWKDETVRYHHEFVTRDLGVKSDEVVYKEGVWSGGGNAGPDLESIIRGLEVATLVFMKFKVVNGEFIEHPIRTVDTGYGIERFSWLSKGSVSGFHAVYDSILDTIFGMAGMKKAEEEMLVKIAELSSLMNPQKTGTVKEARRKIAESVGLDLDELNEVLIPIESAFAVADHTKCLAFLLSEGVVPSNSREGYLTRLMLRRTYRFLRIIGIEDRLLDIVDAQIKFWSHDFQSLKDMRDEIIEILSEERDKFKRTLRKGEVLIKKAIQDLKRREITQIPVETLIELYDSHGIPPEFVRETGEKEGVMLNVPENFYMMVAERHVQSPSREETDVSKRLKEKVLGLQDTRTLFYEKPDLLEFETKVLRVINGKHVVLEKTAFYPEGGGEPGDSGYLEFNGVRTEVVDVQKIGGVIAHTVKGKKPPEGVEIRGAVDQKRRRGLMRHHTSTHILMGAARRLLGEHVWQAGAQKGVKRSRLDISHFKHLTLSEVHEIERLANEVVMENIPVEVTWMPREQAETLYGFRLYQGGVAPGREIRVVKVGDWEVEACGGIHVKSTGEVGFIKIVRTDRIQDGVERIVFSSGISALESVQEDEKLLHEISEELKVPHKKIAETTRRIASEWKKGRRETDRLTEEIAKFTAKEYLSASKETHGIRVIARVTESDVNHLIKIASELVHMEERMVVALFSVDKTASVIVMAGKNAIERGINAAYIARAVASVLGGGGSGRTDFAQGGGNLVDMIPYALQRFEKVVEDLLEKRI